MDLSYLDEETFRVFVQLQLEDIAAVSSETSGQSLTTQENDFVAAAGEYKRELEQALLVFGPGPAEDSNLEAVRPADQAEDAPLPECISCGLQERGSVFKCPCEHDYCGQCMIALLELAVVDESLFPPRCCKTEIPLDLMAPFLTDDQIKTFNEKKLEFGTPNRTYCHDPTCSAFIPPQLLSEQAVACDKCGKQTCTLCKGAGHESEDCPDDTATQEMIRLAQEKGWQKCFSCSRMVELNHGCNHMTCHCHAEFCYVCGVKWKACGCPQWDEANLYARAVRVVNRENRNADLVAEALDQLVEEVRHDLRQNHECNHRDWTYLRGRHACDECRDTLPTFIFRCSRCRMLACRRCRYNRV